MALADELPDPRPPTLADLIEEHGRELLDVLEDRRHRHCDVSTAIQRTWGVRVSGNTIGRWRRLNGIT